MHGSAARNRVGRRREISFLEKLDKFLNVSDKGLKIKRGAEVAPAFALGRAEYLVTGLAVSFVENEVVQGGEEFVGCESEFAFGDCVVALQIPPRGGSRFKE